MFISTRILVSARNSRLWLYVDTPVWALSNESMFILDTYFQHSWDCKAHLILLDELLPGSPSTPPPPPFYTSDRKGVRVEHAVVPSWQA